MREWEAFRGQGDDGFLVPVVQERRQAAKANADGHVAERAQARWPTEQNEISDDDRRSAFQHDSRALASRLALQVSR